MRILSKTTQMRVMKSTRSRRWITTRIRLGLLHSLYFNDQENTHKYTKPKDDDDDESSDDNEESSDDDDEPSDGDDESSDVVDTSSYSDDEYGYWE